MPKKFANENSKAVAARERKKTAKDASEAKKQKEMEDAYWRDDDKQILKKQQRKEEQDRKRQQQLQKKAENKALLEQELQTVKPTSKTGTVPKITRAQIDAAKVKQVPKVEKKVETHLDAPLEENINRLQIDGEEARNVDEAISILGPNSTTADKHPEKRMKAAYNAFEEKRLAELKIENPTLRLSQLKQLVFKEWQKSPENPINQ